MPYVIAVIAVLGIVVIGAQLMLLVPEGWPVGVLAVVTFVAAAWSGRFILRRLGR